MKLQQIPYHRPDVEAVVAKINQLTEDFAKAQSAAEQIEIFKAFEKEKDYYSTYDVLTDIRNSIDTTDPFYEEELNFFNAAAPKITQCLTSFNKAVLESSFKDELRKEFGNYFFDCMEMQQKTFCPEIMELMAEENALGMEYETLYASAKIEFDGRVVNIPQLKAYQQHADRSVRKAALEAEGKFFDSIREKLDDIYDKLVKNRTQQAKLLGFDNYVQVAYLKRCRAYNPEDVAKFRSQILEVMVPQNVEYKKQQAKNIGVEDFKFYDNDFFFADGNPKPKYPVAELLKRTQQMYGEMSAETKELIDLMIENDLFDVEAKAGKRTGGYCTTIADYGYPFVFANFNGTSGDVEVLTHEVGHAFAAYTAQKLIPYSSLRHAPMEACETHSMSMEFLTSPWHHLFFEEDAAKYHELHAKSALYFIPYGIIVDYFQELVYTNPDWTPEERNQCWMQLEKQFRPYIDFGDIPFYSRGAGWQRQIHIYCVPFYYVDYTIAQTMALQFFALFLNNSSEAWKKYIEFVQIGGRMDIKEHIAHCGLVSPFKDGSLAEICKPVYSWIDNLNK